VRRLAAQQAERRAALRRLHAQRDAGEVLAPFSGTVSSWYQPSGAVVSPGDRVVRLVAVERLWVRFAVPVDDVDEVRPGRAVEVVPVPDAPRLHAIIRHVAPELDLASQRMLVEAELRDPRAVRAGQACHVVLPAAGSQAGAEPPDPIVVSSADPTRGG
jgi:multidrug efflux pump subunit AcrA (membrane-fusion protein)